MLVNLGLIEPARAPDLTPQRERPSELDPDNVVNLDQTWIVGRGLFGAHHGRPSDPSLIREKLKDGRLPYDSMPRFWGGAGNGERCDACDEAIPKEELVMEGIASTPTDKKPIQFHVVCFQL